MEVLNGLKAFFLGSAPIIGPLATFACVFLWRKHSALQDQLIAAAEKHATDLKAMADDFAKKLDDVQAEHVETAKDGLRIAGALEPLVRDVRDELLRRGRKPSTPAEKGVVP
jgi:hypothetical protein